MARKKIHKKINLFPHKMTNWKKKYIKDFLGYFIKINK